MEKHRCKPSLTRCPFRGRNCCRPRSAGHKSSSDTHHDEEPVVRSSTYFYTKADLKGPTTDVRSSLAGISPPDRRRHCPDQATLEQPPGFSKTQPTFRRRRC